MGNPLTQEPGIGGVAPDELGQDSAAWGATPHIAFADEINLLAARAFTVVNITVNDTFTTGVANPSGYTKVTNGDIFCRPNYESHLFVLSSWIITATAGGSSPSSSLSISLQLWLNGYFVLISPSGFGNQWTVSIPPVAANTTTTFMQTLLGGIFNLELRAAPASHLLSFYYQISSIPTNWASVQFKPRMTIVQAMPSSVLNFVKV